MPTPVSRSSQTPAPNAIVTRTVELTFQRAPLRPAGSDPARGIEALTWRALSGGSVIASGKTTADGKIVVPIRGGQPSILQLTVGGVTMAEYEVVLRGTPFEAKDTIAGVQRRLRAVGYQIGHTGTGKDGVSGVMNDETDRAILEFQVDESLTLDGKADGTFQTKLGSTVGGTAV